MIFFPNAKINLGLNVIEKRTDGYHNIETLFYPVNLCDSLEIIIGGNKDFSWSSSGLVIDGDFKQNLCFKAYSVIKNDFKLPKIKIHLHKAIPFGAGLGGGSADAAFTLKGINKVCNLNLSNEQLEKYASKIGADCAFFIKNKPAFAEGIGDILSPININLDNYFFALIKPDDKISTPEAYSGITPKKPEYPINEIINLPIESWKNKLVNDFEESIFPNHPKIQQIKKQLYNMGAIYASMTGSGATVFGIFKEKPNIDIFSDCFTYISEHIK